MLNSINYIASIFILLFIGCQSEKNNAIKTFAELNKVRFSSVCGIAYKEYIENNFAFFAPCLNDRFSESNKAEFIVDYYVNHTISNGDRRVYEIILINNSMTLSFDSWPSINYNDVHYKKTKLLTKTEFDEIWRTVIETNVHQIHEGILKPDSSHTEQEILIVKNQTINLAGGMFCYPGHSCDLTPEEMRAEEDSLHQITSTIGGNYTLLFEKLTTYFPNLDSLKSASIYQLK